MGGPAQLAVVQRISITYRRVLNRQGIENSSIYYRLTSTKRTSRLHSLPTVPPAVSNHGGLSLGMMKKLVIGITMLFLFCSLAQADTIETFTSRSSFGGNDFIDWAQLGSGTITSLGTLLNVTSTNGLDATVTAGGQSMGLCTNVASSCFANFAVGDSVLYSGSGISPVILDFSSPVSGVGAQIEQNLISPYTGIITAYDSSNNVLGSFSLDGKPNLDSLGDNSAIFVGLHDLSGANIDHVTFADSGFPSAGFLMNGVSLQTNAVPEPSSLLLLAGGAISLWILRRRQLASIRLRPLLRGDF
jgi:hypothetical protein